MESNYNAATYKNFWEEYEETIAPRLKKIDTLLKTSRFPLSVSETSKALDISNDEVFTILGRLGLANSAVDKFCFFAVLRCGSGRICRLVRRELECGSPHLYKPSDIAYIYDLDENIVKRTCGELLLSEIQEKQFSKLFSMIPAQS